MDKKASEVLEEFLQWALECQTDYDTCKGIIAEEEKKEQDFWHLLEFTGKCEDRSRIATIIHESRIRRRKYKNQMEVLEPLVQYLRREQTKLLLRGFKTVTNTVKTQELRMESEKEYNPKTSIYQSAISG